MTRTYATTLLNLGFSSEYIAEITKKFFHYDKNRINGNAAISEFISFFCDKPKQYRIVFKTKDDIEIYEESLKTFKISLIRDINELGVDLSRHKIQKRDGDIFICMSDIKARDNFSAKSQAEEALEMSK